MSMTNNIIFESINSDRIKDAFLRAYGSFEGLHQHRLTIRKLRVSNTTMRAQPILNFQFWDRKKRHYRIDICDHTTLEHATPLRKLPQEVLIGWFAHELGHIVDYQNRTPLGMLRFGLGYLLMSTYRIGAERQADIYAIEHGFFDYLLATKKYILEQSSLPNHYKKRIEKYYMSPDEIALLLEKRESDDLKMDKII